MYGQLEERFEVIGYKKCSLVKGEMIATGLQDTFKGYISFDLTHLASSGIDLTNINASIITNVTLVDEGDLVEVNHRYIKVKKKLCYRDPFSDGYTTFELLT